MKKQILVLQLVAISFAIFFSSCKKDEVIPGGKDDILPVRFSVEVPQAISQTYAAKKAYSAVDTIQGSDIYRHLGTFIAVGDGAGKVVEGIINGIRYYHINKPLSMTYQSDEDGRAKNLVVTESAGFEDVVWDFQINITDAESEGNTDGGLGLQIFWNTNPVKGIAILKPYNCNRKDNKTFDSPVYRIEYSEAGNAGYDATMLVSIAGIPVENPLVNPYSINTLKMFAGKKGNLVDVYGNTNHPNARFFNAETGFNWAFVASADETKDIAVAEVGLPASNLDESSRSVLLEDNSIKNVFSAQIYSIWPGIDPAAVDAYLFNTGAPGFFNANGFLQGGTKPGAEYDEIVNRMTILSPYNPKEVSNLEISFKLN